MNYWIYQNKKIDSIDKLPEDTLGFVYQIVNITNRKIYIGKKQIKSFRKRKFGKREVASMTDKRLKKYEIIEKEMPGWLEYTGSNEQLNEDIKNGNEIQKYILRLCKTKKELTYYETKALFCNETIEDDFEHYYNGNILSKFFPKDLKNG